MLQAWHRLLRTISLCLALIAVIYGVAILFSAFQVLAPNICTHAVCRQVEVPREAFGRMLFFGFNAGTLALLWLAVYLLASAPRNRDVLPSSPLLIRIAIAAGFSSAAVAAAALAFPIVVAIVYVGLVR